MEIRAVAIAALIAIGQSLHAASFDCAKARRGYEALICANQELSKADDALADAYHRAHGALASIGSPKEAKRAQQRLDEISNQIQAGTGNQYPFDGVAA
jgi:uncharacterized protein